MAYKTVVTSAKNGESDKEIYKGSTHGIPNSQKAFYRDEYSAFVGAMKKSFNADLKEFLAFCYGNPDKYDRKIRKEHFFLSDIFLNINTTSTVAAMTGVVDPYIDFASGWMPRHLIVNPDYNRKTKKITLKTEKQAALSIELVEWIKKLNNDLEDGNEEFCVESGALEYWNTWNENITDALRKNNDETQARFFGRYSIMALKISMLFEIGKNSLDNIDNINIINNITSHTISLESVYCSTYLIENVFLRYAVKFENSVKLGTLGNHITLIETILTEKGQMSRSDLLRASRLGKGPLDDVIGTLIEREDIEIWEDINEDNKRKTIMYRYIHHDDAVVTSGSINKTNFKNQCDIIKPVLEKTEPIKDHRILLTKENRYKILDEMEEIYKNESGELSITIYNYKLFSLVVNKEYDAYSLYDIMGDVVIKYSLEKPNSKPDLNETLTKIKKHYEQDKGHDLTYSNVDLCVSTLKSLFPDYTDSELRTGLIEKYNLEVSA
jgi:hypothetical protein